MVTYSALNAITMTGFISQVDANLFLGLWVGLPAVLTAISAWNSRQTKKALRPNGGSSPMDAINRIEGAVKDLSKRMTAVEDYITNPKEKQ